VRSSRWALFAGVFLLRAGHAWGFVLACEKPPSEVAERIRAGVQSYAAFEKGKATVELRCYHGRWATAAIESPLADKPGELLVHRLACEIQADESWTCRSDGDNLRLKWMRRRPRVDVYGYGMDVGAAHTAMAMFERRFSESRVVANCAPATGEITLPENWHQKIAMLSRSTETGLESISISVDESDLFQVTARKSAGVGGTETDFCADEVME
jgi:hypothetical protein